MQLYGPSVADLHTDMGLGTLLSYVTAIGLLRIYVASRTGSPETYGLRFWFSTDCARWCLSYFQECKSEFVVIHQQGE